MGPRFLVDVNVGALRKWLRALGYDAAYEPHLDDGSLVAYALRERRALLTKDTHIQERRTARWGQLRILLVQGDDPLAQAQQVVEAFGPPETDAFSRCIECNQVLLPVAKTSVQAEVPPYVYKTQEGFHRCPSCRKLYWQGTHWAHMKERLSIITRRGITGMGITGRSAGEQGRIHL